MKVGASLVMSGFYVGDLEVIRGRGVELGLRWVASMVKEEWVAVHFIK
jgi:hypothetical protein